MSPMFCFPNIGRRGDRGPLHSSPAAMECPIASVESMTDDEPSSPTVIEDSSPRPRQSRWTKPVTRATKLSDTSSSSSANNSRSNSCNRDMEPLILTINREEPEEEAQTPTPPSPISQLLRHYDDVSSSSHSTEVSSRRQNSVESASSSCGSSGVDMLAPASTQDVTTSLKSCHAARFKLLHEGDIQVCYLNHTRTVISKILSSKFLRRWETHRLYLNDACISSKTPTGFLENSVMYSSIVDVYIVARWDVGHKFYIRVVVSDGSLLIQANSAYIRDQWYHSILWKKNIFKYRNILRPTARPEVILKELKSLVEYSTSTPLQDECVATSTIDAISHLLIEDASWASRENSEEAITTLTPLLDNSTPSPDMCRFFSRHCCAHPRSPVIADVLTPTIHRILKHNVDFGKSPQMRRFVQDYMQALFLHNAGEEVIRKFITSVHGPGSACPHPRVLPNLVSVCLAAVCNNFEERRAALNLHKAQDDLQETLLQCHVSIFLHISEYEDWRLGLAQFLHPIPFPDEALGHESFIQNLVPVVERIAVDPRCEVHQMVLGIREGKEGWFHIYCPSSMVCVDEGRLWCIMVKTLLQCCCRRKRFLAQLTKQLGTCLLLALRGHAPAQEALCLMLEWQLIEQEDQKMQLVTTLQSTESGRERYATLCERQMHLKELQQKGGPRKLTLPSRSTDADIAQLLSVGSFGNLECLSLAFTHVTSACAEQLIKLPALRYLNLWATQFGDTGLLLISEHLPKLQVLNLCETPVSDKGIASLGAMTNLCKLNLNSTKLTATTFEALKKKLPGLQEFDVRYTEAW